MFNLKLNLMRGLHRMNIKSMDKKKIYTYINLLKHLVIIIDSHHRVGPDGDWWIASGYQKLF